MFGRFGSGAGSVKPRNMLLATAGTLALVAGGQGAYAESAPEASAPSVPYAGITRAPTIKFAAADQRGAPLPAEVAPGGDAETTASDIVVTGSRIVRDGYSAPTPVAVLGSADIQAQVPANLSTFVNQLPAVTTGSTSANSSGSLSNGIAGINSVNLRGLGAARTLVLLDGQRSVASSVGGIVDVNTFPQDLVERVEVVTGGASAQYGSDAVGGVINFILDKKFKGFKLLADQGISTYGDGRNYRFSGSAGLSFLDDRLHVLLNASYYRQYGVDTIDRDWNNSGYFQINNPAYTATNGLPQRLVGSGFGPGTYTAGGLITAVSGGAASSLVNTYFLGNGQTAVLNKGVFNATSTPWMVGGDYQTTLAGHQSTNSLLPTEERISLFERTSFDITDRIQIYGQLSWNRYEGQSYYQQTPSTGVTIKGDNAYLLTYYPAIAAKVGAAGSITIGTSNAGFPVPGSSNRRDVYRYVGGATGDFDLIGRTWKWDTYFQHGMTKAHEELTNTWNVANMALAQDAVISNGQIVCRSTLTSPGNGCVPIDRLGTAGPSAAALAYIYGGTGQPYRDETVKEDVASATMNGEIFTLPGGKAAVAFGGEWRKEQISGYVPAEFQPIRNANGTTTATWLYGNYLPNFGKYTVKEGFIEIDLPVIKSVNINAAGRYTDYSTSGSVQTWKIGGTYQPIRDIKFRGTYSHDIRAPNLQELFAAGTARTNSVILPSNAPQTGSQQFTESTIGNTSLKPEKANTWTVGAVATPRFLPGFTASFDYYDIKITDAIGSITAQNTVDFCYSGASQYCGNIVYGSDGKLSQIVIQPFNFQSQRAKGFDIEASYRTELSALSAKLPGTFSVHTAITHYISNVVNNGIFPVDYAGVNGGSLAGTFNAPNWVYRISAFYELEPVTLNFVARGFSDGVYGNDYIQCTSACPTSTTQYRTINNNHIAGAYYFDGSASVKFKAYGTNGTFTFIVNNMLNKKPVLIGNGPDGNNTPAYPQTNRSLYDVIGRTFRVAAKFTF